MALKLKILHSRISADATMSYDDASSSGHCRICGSPDEGSRFTYHYGKEHAHTKCANEWRDKRLERLSYFLQHESKLSVQSLWTLLTLCMETDEDERFIMSMMNDIVGPVGTHILMDLLTHENFAVVDSCIVKHLPLDK